VLPPHSTLIPRPRAIWNEHGTSWKSRFDEDTVNRIRSCFLNAQTPVPEKTLNILKYRPDLFKRIGPVAIENKALNQFIRTNPAAALTLLKSFYAETSSKIETSLSGSGESIHELISWANIHHKNLQQPESFYRGNLVIDSYWGYYYAQTTHNLALISEIKEWCADERYQRASAAALFLIFNKDQSIKPYRDLILQNSFYSYISLSRFAQSGQPINPDEITLTPKWAAHFALSPHCKNAKAFTAIAAQDLAWLIEIAHCNHSIKDPVSKNNLINEIQARGSHPVLADAIELYLESLKTPNQKIIQSKVRSSAVPLVFAQGKAAEEKILLALKVDKNTEVWRPTKAEIESKTFKKIVGKTKYTMLGIPRGTVLDSTEGGYAEIKSGNSPLRASYQLRLQTYKSVIDERPLTIYTNRPASAEFKKWCSHYQVQFKQLPKDLTSPTL
jgi:hypothetical protein